MTKADLIEEVSRVVEMTRKESEVIVEAIFRQHRTFPPVRRQDRNPRFGSFRTRQRQPVSDATETGARVEVPPRRFRISSRARN